MSSSYIFGKNSVKVLLATNPKRIQRILIGDYLKPDKRVDDIYQLAKTHGIVVQKANRAKLDSYLQDIKGSMGLADDDNELHHQGVIALAAPKAFLAFSEVLTLAKTEVESGKRPLLLALDSITDPRNLGAILRVADGAGILAVIMPKNNSAALNPAASKTASGAEESVPVCLVPNLSQALDALKDNGFWAVGSTGGEKARHYADITYDMPVVLVMGSEGEGMRPLVEKHCDFLAKIPMAGVVDSLNVAVATGILAYHIRSVQQAGLPPE